MIIDATKPVKKDEGKHLGNADDESRSHGDPKSDPKMDKGDKYSQDASKNKGNKPEWDRKSQSAPSQNKKIESPSPGMKMLWGSTEGVL